MNQHCEEYISNSAMKVCTVLEINLNDKYTLQ